MSVEKIIALLKNRDQKGLEYLYDHYSAALLGVIVRILQSEKVSEEVLQQTFLKIWDNISSYNLEKGTLFTWMCRIARNTAIDQKRLKQFQNNQNTDSFQETIHNRKVEVINTDGLDASKLINSLDDAHKVVIDVVYLQGYSHSQAAEKLNIPLGTVKTRLRNATLKLREFLKNEKGLFINFFIFIFLILFF